ncbi:yecA family protein [Devosia crocina]|uniref:YecA family protein n=1 Tax=Devosia crocina TaxID=429728 RepID=A0A1I7NP79_9HYPH|nr:UPF0149 family protein [Devosia crocina]SFV36484.1 yecA family protein [Devosia crocina]
MTDFSDLSDSLLRLETLLGEAGEDAMLLTELDGFLCAIVVSPEPIAREEWWPFDWLADERGQLKPGHEELETLVMARLAQIEQELAADEFAPLYEVDDEEEEVVWEAWLAGFQQAMLLRFEAWDELLRDTESQERGDAAMGLASALMLAQPDSGPDETAGEEEWADHDEMVEAMPGLLAHTASLLYELHRKS